MRWLMYATHRNLIFSCQSNVAMYCVYHTNQTNDIGYSRMVCIDINDARNVSDTDQYQMSVTSSVNRGGEPGAASKEYVCVCMSVTCV